MSKEYIPTEVDAYRFAENAAHLHGTLPVKNMTRLAPSMTAAEGEVEVDIHFGSEAKIKFLKGSVKAFLTVQCQRCLESFAYEVLSQFGYGIVKTDAEAKKLPKHFDPVLVEEDNLNIADLVEEELIINLPIVPMHDPVDCKVKLPIVVIDDPESTTVAKKANPFKVIETLKGKPE